jgi:hypothetical protein
MEKGLEPGADFFDDASSGSDWEDSEGEVAQTFPEVEGLRLGSLVHSRAGKHHARSRGRSRNRSILTALPLFDQQSAEVAGLGPSTNEKPLSIPTDHQRSKRARQISLQRLNKDNIRVVHNRSSAGTPRDSLKSNGSGSESQFGDMPKPFSPRSIASSSLPKRDSYQTHHRRNTSENILAGSIIDAHVMTMRALESLSPSPSSILTNSNSRTFAHSTATTDLPQSSSLTNDRHIMLSPLSTASAQRDRNRPAHLPDHFIETPYPFTAKEFPKPKTRPRPHSGFRRLHDAGVDGFERLDSGYGEDTKKEYDDQKGKHVLGLVASEGEYDLRSRLERNVDAQGLIRSDSGPEKESSGCVVWLSLERNAWRSSSASKNATNLVKVIVPSNLTTSGPNPEKSKGSALIVDFDDKFFAEQLLAGYCTVSGSWFRRFLSARKLKKIRLGQINTWSTSASPTMLSSASRLLATGTGIHEDADIKNTFTEDSLMKLYNNPKGGKARYSWVHWARRVAASNVPRQRSRPSNHLSARSPRHQSNNIAMSGEKNETFTTAHPLPDIITTIQFVHSLSMLRILSTLLLMLAFSILAALCWVFLGTNTIGGISSNIGVQRMDRVESGMAIGIMVLLLESVGFGTWIWLS